MMLENSQALSDSNWWIICKIQMDIANTRNIKMNEDKLERHVYNNNEKMMIFIQNLYEAVKQIYNNAKKQQQNHDSSDACVVGEDNSEQKKKRIRTWYDPSIKYYQKWLDLGVMITDIRNGKMKLSSFTLDESVQIIQMERKKPFTISTLQKTTTPENGTINIVEETRI
eukprot:UN04002